mmetsp:Transcript_104555/g.181588  ORF Transcript_104555/g.181588 Transcript_104555/m.181588 type:complete len:333 (-) Transcript_104555:3903-4901(-)
MDKVAELRSVLCRVVFALGAMLAWKWLVKELGRVLRVFDEMASHAMHATLLFAFVFLFVFLFVPASTKDPIKDTPWCSRSSSRSSTRSRRANSARSCIDAHELFQSDAGGKRRWLFADKQICNGHGGLICCKAYIQLLRFAEGLVGADSSFLVQDCIVTPMSENKLTLFTHIQEVVGHTIRAADAILKIVYVDKLGISVDDTWRFRNPLVHSELRSCHRQHYSWIANVRIHKYSKTSIGTELWISRNRDLKSAHRFRPELQTVHIPLWQQLQRHLHHISAVGTHGRQCHTDTLSVGIRFCVNVIHCLRVSTDRILAFKKLENDVVKVLDVKL